MNFAISSETFSRANEGLHHGELFELPRDSARVYLTTHTAVGRTDLLHYHDEPHLTLILNGGVTNKRAHIDQEFVAGGLIFFRSGEPHRTIPRSFPTTYLSLQFGPRYFGANPFIEQNLELTVGRGPAAKFAMLKIFKEIRTADEMSLESIEMLTLGLAAEAEGVSERRPSWMEKIVELLKDNWNANISLDDLARAANVHPKTVSKYFPRFFNCTLGEYRRQLKVERAVALIKTTRLSLTDIAYECNFYDQSHFIRSFREVTGISPRQFKRL